MINVLEEFVRNQRIVLQFRINGIASWITLKSSEIKNFLSWWITVQYWNIFLFPPPPAILLFHISSDQRLECSNLFQRSSFSLQNSIAPSSSQSNSQSRRGVFSLFATGYAWSDWAPGSISIHILSRIGTVLDDEQIVESLLGFALALYRLANANTSVFVVEVSCSLSSCRSNLWPTYSIHEKFWPTSEKCLGLQIQFWFPLHVYLEGNWLWPPTLVQFGCSLKSNLSGQLICRLVVTCTHDMSLVL